MSNDSISSISSGPVPTTPTEIISIEMDRFGDVWARLNIDPKNPILLQKKQPQMICENEMLPLPIEPDQPIWDHKQTVDTHVPGQPQTYFAQRYKDGKVVLQSEIHISTLKAALELAHRLVFGQVGRRLAGARKSEEAAAKVEELSTCNPWTFALELLPVEGRLTGFHQDRPRNLFLNFTVLDNAAEAAQTAKKDPSEENIMMYKRHIFMLGVVYGRGLFESLQDIIQDQTSLKTRVGSRPAWIDWEHRVIGGYVVGRGSPAFQGYKSEMTSLAIERKRVPDTMPSFFILNDKVVKAVVDEDQDWEALLPLTPTGDWIKGKPSNVIFKPATVSREGATLAFNCGYLTRIRLPHEDEEL